MTVINFPIKRKKQTVSGVVEDFSAGKYVELFIVAITSDGTIEQLEFIQNAPSRQATGSDDQQP